MKYAGYEAATDTENSQVLCDRALRVVRVAQVAHRDNGALWVAESLVHFVNGDDNAAIAALKEAAQRRYWHADTQHAYKYLRSLLERNGFPAFDATAMCSLTARPWVTMWRATDYFENMMTQAVLHGDDSGFAAMLQLLFQLRNCTSTHSHSPYPIIRSFRSDELIAAMASRMGTHTPAELDAPYGERGKAQRNLMFEYVRRYAGIEQAFEILELDRKVREEINSWIDDDLWRSSWYNFLWFAAKASSLLAIILLAAGIGFLATSIPFRLARGDGFVHPSIARMPTFWVAAILVVAASGIFIYRACDVTLHRAGMADILGEDMVGHPQWETWILVLAPIGMLMVQLVAHYKGKRQAAIARDFGAVPLFFYVAMVLLSVYLRDLCVRQCDWKYGHDPTTYIIDRDKEDAL